MVELQEGVGSPQAEMLKKERGKLMRELREKVRMSHKVYWYIASDGIRVCVCLQVQERLKLFRRNSEGAAASLAYQYQNCTREQVNPCVCVREEREGEERGRREREEREGGERGKKREGGERGRKRGYTFPLMCIYHLFELTCTLWSCH